MTEEHVVGLLAWNHEADSALGVLGAQRGSTLELKDFGRMIMREHTALRRDAVSMANRLRLAPKQPTVLPDMPPASIREFVDTLPPGKAWDQAYLELAIAAHRSSMENLARALAATKSPEIRQYIERSTPIIQKHLDRALRLQQTGGGGDAKSR